ncbi:organic hydroperoxide resistance protein [Cellulophaga baltica]|uniref:organic hydroperoxide resistance protein n=1 Tax=Cellulophaga TaxID=104264 RepID=UPI001C077731|nr:MULTISPECIES: organic hydroperoxide resistance protein [Cellulophaga]MBU2996436.1 organic hydroperoxide resistance protein [Cellulophaga baltica]MDO6767831.1 organic hydroperoxide resistance protein [Cellulophaga sp. 1_MG-2023]
MKQLFETAATTTGGRNGHVKSSDGVIEFDLKMPIQMGGEGGKFTNPEQLFAAGYSACFDSALQMVAGAEKIAIESATTANIGLVMHNPTSYGLTAVLDVEVKGVEKEKAQELLEKAHAVCPYSVALKGNVDVKINLK